MKDTFIVNFISGPGAGKTTISAMVFAKLKIRGFVAEYVQELAKMLVWTREFDTLNNQHYLSNKQYKILKSIDGEVDFIVTDGPLVHGLYYNRHNLENTSNIEKTEKMILGNIKEFRNINVFLMRGDFAYEASGRQQDEHEAKEIDIVMQHFMRKFMIPFVCFSSSPDNVDDIVEYIIEMAEQATAKDKIDKDEE